MPHFPREIFLRRQLPIARDIFERNGLEKITLEALTSQIEHFKIHVRLIGSHDSGKTSLLSTVSRPPHLDLEELSVFESVDMRAIVESESRFTYYCLVANVAEGTMNPALANVLQKIAEHKGQIFVVFTKTDVLGMQENQEVVRQVTSAVTRLMGYAPMAVATTSAKKKNTSCFSDIIDQLEADAERMFESQIVGDFLNELGRARQHLMVLADQADKSAAADIDVLTTQMQACHHRQL